jgi:hypothetical protein
MNFKLLCTDIDGTLLNKDRKLSALTIQEIKRIRKEIPVVLISSRMPSAIRHLQEELDILEMPLIAYNGGLILDQGKVLESSEIAVNVLKTVIDLCSQTHIHLSLYHNDDWFVPEMDYWATREANNTQVTPAFQSLDKTRKLWESENKGPHKIMAMGDEIEIERLYDTLKELHAEDLHLYRSKPTYIEIASKSISKETAIRKLLAEKYSSITMNDIIAFGDNYNDLEMLKAVGMGVAVANAKPEILDVANKVTASNLADGVALSIQKYL